MSEVERVDDLKDDIASRVAETPVVTPAPEPSKSSDPTGLRETITKAVRESAAKEAAKTAPAEAKVEIPEGERLRGPDGKFLPKDVQGAPAKAEQSPKTAEKPLEGAQPGADPQKKADAAPGTWRADAKAKWESVDPVIRAEVLKREAESAREVSKFQQQIQQINQAYTPIEQVIGPKRAAWRAQFGSEGEALKRLVNISDYASADPNGFLAFYLSQPDVAGRIDLQKVFGQQAPADDIRAHPVVKQLHETVSGLQQQLQGFLGQHQTQQVNTVEQQITEFASAKGPDGTPLRQHFDAVREDVFNLIPALRVQFPQASVTQILEKAYQTAIHTNDTVAGEIRRIEEERIRSEIEKAERAKKAQLAAKSIPPGAPAGSSPNAPTDASDLRATIKRNFAAWKNGESARI